LSFEKFNTHEEARQAKPAYNRSLTPQQRLDILLELIDGARDHNDPASERLERVYRIVKFEE
jgi:hypothetical protein